MNIFKKAYCRIYQTAFRIALPLLPYREPEILVSNDEVLAALKTKKCKTIFFVTDKVIRGLGLTSALEATLKSGGLNVVIFDGVMPNPTISLIEKGKDDFIKNNCDCIIALGGGSVIDTAKAVGARVVKPNLSVRGMKGLLKIRKKLPTFVAIPTTAGTGSETTLAAVITDDESHYKYAINDFSLIPHYALLDYNLTLGLNANITYTTGMDALTHSIEAFIGRSTTKQTREAALQSCKLIYENLNEVVKNPTNADARQNMLKASYLAGVAFTQSYVGYVHAIAHSLGGKYGVAHGLANSIILPVVLREFGASASKKLAKIARYIGLSEQSATDEVAAEQLISYIEQSNKDFGLPNYISQLKQEDIDALAKVADKEANPLYPVPKLMDRNQLAEIYKKLLKE